MNIKKIIDSSIDYSQRYSLIILFVALILFLLSRCSPQQPELNTEGQPIGTILINYITAEGKIITRAPDGSEIPDAELPDRKGNTAQALFSISGFISSGSPINVWYTGIDGADKCIRVDYNFKTRKVVKVLGACK